MTVFNLKSGESATVIKISVSDSAQKRLSSMGIRVGRVVTALGFSLFSGSVLVQCGAVRVGIRKVLAECIEVKK